jgi:membrane-bound ClpP family serine protease
MLFMLFLVGKIVQIRRKPVAVGVHSLVGTQGTVRPGDFVFVNGELWHARTESGERLIPGASVEVAGVEDLTLVVRPVST